MKEVLGCMAIAGSSWTLFRALVLVLERRTNYHPYVKTEEEVRLHELLTTLLYETTELADMEEQEVLRRVVILGAGYAGLEVARLLAPYQENLHVTIIETRNFHFHKIGALRSTWKSGWENRLLLDVDRSVEHALIVHEQVVAVNPEYVLLANDDIVDFDYLICATGRANRSVGEPDPLKFRTRDEVTSYYESIRKIIRQSKRVVVVGAGVVGFELVGEIVDKVEKVYLVNSRSSLLGKYASMFTYGFSDAALKLVLDAGVELLNNDRIVNITPDLKLGYTVGPFSELVTKNGKVLKDIDVILWCIGPRKFTVEESIYPSEWLAKDGTGELAVRDTLQLESHDHIFAVGDIAHTCDWKVAFRTPLQASVVVRNIVELSTHICTEHCYDHTLSTKYHPIFKSPSWFILPFGENKGLVDLGYFSLGSWACRLLKSKDLMCDMRWNQLMNVNAPVVE